MRWISDHDDILLYLGWIILLLAVVIGYTVFMLQYGWNTVDKLKFLITIGGLIFYLVLLILRLRRRKRKIDHPPDTRLPME
jgi:hypothetical protein